MPEHAGLTNVQLVDARFDHFEIDSLSSMEFIMEVETEFDVELDEDAVNNCVTVADVAALVSETLRA